jgi:hypothetical protein
MFDLKNSNGLTLYRRFAKPAERKSGVKQNIKTENAYFSLTLIVVGWV